MSTEENFSLALNWNDAEKILFWKYQDVFHNIFNEIYEKVRFVFDDEQAAIVKESMDSVPIRLGHAAYHIMEMRRLYDEYIEANKDSFEKSRITRSESYLRCFIRSVQAHGIAAIGILHSISDILAVMIYLSLKANDGEWQKPGFNLLRSLTEVCKSHPEAELLFALAVKLTEHQSYKYVVALSNIKKHHKMVGMPLVQQGAQTYFMVESFEGKKGSFDRKELTEFLEEEIIREQELIVEFFTELRRLLNK